MVNVQIEHADAVKNLDAILATDGLSGIVIGPNDLAGSMGHIGRYDHPDVQKAIDVVIKRARAANKFVGLGSSAEPSELADWARRGVQWLLVGADFVLLRKGTMQTIAAARAELAQRPSALRTVGFAFPPHVGAVCVLCAPSAARTSALAALRDFYPLMSYDSYGRYRLTSHFVETMEPGQCDWFAREGAVGCETSRNLSHHVFLAASAGSLAVAVEGDAFTPPPTLPPAEPTAAPSLPPATLLGVSLTDPISTAPKSAAFDPFASEPVPAPTGTPAAPNHSSFTVQGATRKPAAAQPSAAATTHAAPAAHSSNHHASASASPFDEPTSGGHADSSKSPDWSTEPTLPAASSAHGTTVAWVQSADWMPRMPRRSACNGSRNRRSWSDWNASATWSSKTPGKRRPAT